MIAHWDIIQGTSEWHQIRYGKIGGSTSKGLFVDSDTLLDELISARLEPFELDDDPYTSAAMDRGSEYEPMARRALEEYTGISFSECGWLQSEENELLGISPDGINKSLTIACEIKCPGRKKHTQTLRGGVIPLEHNFQLVHNFTVNPALERIYFCSFRPECKFDIFVKQLYLHSLINLGTKAKPIIKTVEDWANVSRLKADALLVTIHSEINKLDF